MNHPNIDPMDHPDVNMIAANLLINRLNTGQYVPRGEDIADTINHLYDVQQNLLNNMQQRYHALTGPQMNRYIAVYDDVIAEIQTLRDYRDQMGILHSVNRPRRYQDFTLPNPPPDEYPLPSSPTPDDELGPRQHGTVFGTGYNKFLYGGILKHYAR